MQIITLMHISTYIQKINLAKKLKPFIKKGINLHRGAKLRFPLLAIQQKKRHGS